MSKPVDLRQGPFAPRDGVTPRVFIDLRTNMLPEAEMQSLASAPVRVIDHEYGAWVNVPPEEADGGDNLSDDEGWEDFANLRKVLLFAREMGAYWVNFDADGFDRIESLPTFDW